MWGRAIAPALDLGGPRIQFTAFPVKSFHLEVMGKTSPDETLDSQPA